MQFCYDVSRYYSKQIHITFYERDVSSISLIKCLSNEHSLTSYLDAQIPTRYQSPIPLFYSTRSVQFGGKFGADWKKWDFVSRKMRWCFVVVVFAVIFGRVLTDDHLSVDDEDVIQTH